MKIELAWGRIRRAWLRKFRPGYVRKMEQKRQGHCDQCPHNVIDPRDLKFYRNVCGYWFRSEDDPFRWRNRLGLARVGLAEIVCFSLVFLASSILIVIAGAFLSQWIWLAVPVILVIWFQLIWFFRDPNRDIPQDPDVLLSPADGTITNLEEVHDPDFPGTSAFRISIFLSVFNVHVNRAPRTARVTTLRYFPGAFLDARDPAAATRNEQLWIDLEESNPPRRIRVKQISGAIARRIVCSLKKNEAVRAGDRFGMIKFGSRTDILLASQESIELKVKIGDKVKGGSTILLRFQAG